MYPFSLPSSLSLSLFDTPFPINPLFLSSSRDLPPGPSCVVFSLR